jgi:hypothetical protein
VKDNKAALCKAGTWAAVGGILAAGATHASAIGNRARLKRHVDFGIQKSTKEQTPVSRPLNPGGEVGNAENPQLLSTGILEVEWSKP